jgi:phosphoglycerate dehydrogenase-like enzyme
MSDTIRGAVLDVDDGELAGRPPRAELLDLPQILLTPHIAASGDPGRAEPVRRLFAENLRRFLDGRPLLSVMDRDCGYQRMRDQDTFMTASRTRRPTPPLARGQHAPASASTHE